MAKTQRSKGYSIYPYLGVKTGPKSKLHYVNIRVIKDSENVYDVGVYTEQGERVKCAKDNWNDHDIKSVPNRDELNARITALLLDIKSFIDSSTGGLFPEITKEKIEDFIYPNGLLSKAKNQRVKHLTIPIYSQVVNAEFQGLFNEVQQAIKSDFIFQKTKMENTSLSFNDDSINKWYRRKRNLTDGDLNMLTEVTIMNLLLDKNIQSYFEKDISDKAIEYVQITHSKFKDITFFKRLVNLKNKYPELEKEANKYFQANREFLFKGDKANFYNNNTIFKYPVVDYVTLNKTETDTFKKLGGRVTNTVEVVEFKESITSTPKTTDPAKRYETNDYDHNNIFEVVAQVLYLNNPNKNKPYTHHFKGVAKNLLQYKAIVNPDATVDKFNIEWVINFFMWLKKEGYPDVHINGFNPFKLEVEKYKKATMVQYDDITLLKKLDTLRQMLTHLMEEEKLPSISLKKLTPDRFHLNNVKQDTKTDFHLTKQEVDKLFFYEFKDGDKFTKEELTKARDLFILCFFFGGLRPNVELLYQNGVRIMDDKHQPGKKIVRYRIGKDAKNDVNENPICSYSEIVLKKYNYDFNKVKMNAVTFLKLTKEIGKLVFDRPIEHIEQKNGVRKIVTYNLKDKFTPYFARHTFEQILRNAGISSEDRKEFTGRSKGSNAQKHYSSLQNKREVMSKIKPVRVK